MEGTNHQLLAHLRRVHYLYNLLALTVLQQFRDPASALVYRLDLDRSLLRLRDLQHHRDHLLRTLSYLALHQTNFHPVP